MERSQGMDEDTKPDRCIPEFSSGDIEFTNARLPPPASLDTRLSIPKQIWESTLTELRERSAGWRESAAIFCGRVIHSEWTVETVRFHHHLCDDRGRPLSIRLTESAKYELYRELNRLGLRLIAGIHTHPEDWVDLSWIDQQNQLCSRRGFWSIVVPWYAEQSWEVVAMGAHIRTLEGWCRLTTEQVQRHVRIME
jgi:proteasome lid subunit RPN8/RPN11